MKYFFFSLLLMVPMFLWSQNGSEIPDFTSRVGIVLGGSGGKAYGKSVEGAHWSSALTTGAFVDWQGRYGGFKTSLLWDTYEGSSFKNGTLSLEFLPKLQSAKTGIWGGAGIYTLLNAPELLSGKSGIGWVGEIGWSFKRFLISARVRNTMFDLSSELSGRQSTVEVGVRAYYALFFK